MTKGMLALFLLLLTACDNRTPEEREIDHLLQAAGLLEGVKRQRLEPSIKEEFDLPSEIETRDQGVVYLYERLRSAFPRESPLADSSLAAYFFNNGDCETATFYARQHIKAGGAYIPQSFVDRAEEGICEPWWPSLEEVEPPLKKTSPGA